MEKKKALGKGIDALFPSDDIYDEVVSDNTNGDSVIKLDVNLIDNNVRQPRKIFDEEKIQELSDSIKEHGVVQPIIVTKRGERYLIVAGERRYRASRLAGLREVPVIIREMADEKVLEIALIENVQREDLNPIEEALAIRHIMQQQGLTQEQAAAKLGMKRVTVTNLLRILNLPDTVHEFIRSGELTLGHAKVLLSAKESIREELAEKAAHEGWSVKMLESKVMGNRINPQHQNHARKTTDPIIRDAENRMRTATGGKVRINGDRDKGKIVIEYYSPEQLDAIYNLICGEQ